MWSLALRIKGRTQAQDVSEQGVEEDKLFRVQVEVTRDWKRLLILWLKLEGRDGPDSGTQEREENIYMVLVKKREWKNDSGVDMRIILELQLKWGENWTNLAQGTDNWRALWVN